MAQMRINSAFLKGICNYYARVNFFSKKSRKSLVVCRLLHNFATKTKPKGLIMYILANIWWWQNSRLK